MDHLERSCSIVRALLLDDHDEAGRLIREAAATDPEQVMTVLALVCSVFARGLAQSASADPVTWFDHAATAAWSHTVWQELDDDADGG